MAEAGGESGKRCGVYTTDLNAIKMIEGLIWDNFNKGAVPI